MKADAWKTLILATPVDMVRAMCRNEEAHKHKSIPLSNSVLKQRRFAIASNLKSTYGASERSSNGC